MPKFASVPRIIEAEQFYDNRPLPFNDRGPVVCLGVNGWYVVTEHGDPDYLQNGDWVILESCGIEGRASACKPEVFAVCYRPVEGD